MQSNLVFIPQESLQLRKVVYGERSIKVAESKQNLAPILDSQGFLQEAEGLLIEALSIYADTLGKSSPEAAVTMNNLAVLLTHLGRLDEAETMLRQTGTPSTVGLSITTLLPIAAARLVLTSRTHLIT